MESLSSLRGDYKDHKMQGLFSTTNLRFFPMSTKNTSSNKQMSMNLPSSKTIMAKDKKNINFNPNKTKLKFSSPALRLKCKDKTKSFSPIKLDDSPIQELLKENKLLKDQIQRLLIENKTLKEENKAFLNLYQSSNNNSNNNTHSKSSSTSIFIKDKINLKKRKPQKFYSNDLGTTVGLFEPKLELMKKKECKECLSLSKDNNYTVNSNTVDYSNRTLGENFIHKNNSKLVFRNNLINETNSLNVNSVQRNSKNVPDTIDLLSSSNTENTNKELTSQCSIRIRSSSNKTFNTSNTNIVVKTDKTDKQTEEEYEIYCQKTFKRVKNILEKYNQLLNPSYSEPISNTNISSNPNMNIVNGS